LTLRTAIGSSALASAALLLSTGGGVAPAQGVKKCTWGGTPVAPTGIFENSPGLTNTPNPGVITFWIRGALGGDCQGTMYVRGAFDPGGSCGAGTFSGTVRGLPGVERLAGSNAAGFLPSRLYDKAGNVVGSENANAYTTDNILGGPIAACGTPEGLTRGNFSSVIVLFGNDQ
jgi:hypothetical protein